MILSNLIYNIVLLFDDLSISSQVVNLGLDGMTSSCAKHRGLGNLDGKRTPHPIFKETTY